MPDGDGYGSLVEVLEDGLKRLSVTVSGIHCAACIQKIEHSLQSQDEITRARLNFSTQRLVIEWQGDERLADRWVDLVEQSGAYQVQPFDIHTRQDVSAQEERFLLLCMGVAGFAMGNVMLLSVGVWAANPQTMGTAVLALMHWISALIAIPTVLFSGQPFFRSAWGALGKGTTNMDVPISLALILACAMSLWETAHDGHYVYFESAVMLMFFLLVGRYLDFKARQNARQSATGLLDRMTGFATVRIDGKAQRIYVRDIVPGMELMIASGESIPVDGEVLWGKSDVDVALVTGETLPETVEKGHILYSGSVNLSAPLRVKAIKRAENSLLADLVRLMENATQAQAHYVRLADRAARFYTPVVHLAAALTFLGWWWLGGADWQQSVMIAITVLIITCPCALGLAVPVVQVLASGLLMKQGVLIKSGDALERLAGIDRVMLDKTGTLTLGKPQLRQERLPKEYRLAASLAVHSHHPLAQGLALSYAGALVEVEDVREMPGQGVCGVYRGQDILLGSRDFCSVSDAELQALTLDKNCSEIWFRSGVDLQVFCFEDCLRPHACEVIESFRRDGLQVVLVSGDRLSVVEMIGQKAGIETFFGEQTPQDKFSRLQAWKDQEGRRVLMVGDGLNDGPVLAGAHVSIAPGSAIDIAQKSADIIFMGDSFAPVYEAYNTACFAQRLIRSNFVLAVVYNMLAIPLAVAGMVTPLIAALAMSGSSILVILNSMRIRWKV